MSFPDDDDDVHEDEDGYKVRYEDDVRKFAHAVVNAPARLSDRTHERDPELPTNLRDSRREEEEKEEEEEGTYASRPQYCDYV